MHIDLYVALAALIVGFTVGLTGMGGGALMTPILVLLFNITPSAAISSDLVAAMVMKPIGSSVHMRRGTVRFELVKWLCIGSVPAAASGVFILRALGDSEDIQNTIKIMLGITLTIAATSMVVKAWLQGRRNARERHEERTAPVSLAVKPAVTIAVGAVGGLLVGLTSVGSGSIIIVCLMLLYPRLRGAELVGTDLVQAVPLVTSAALMHVFFGDFELGLTSSVLLGSIPGVYLGARMSSKAPDGVIRPALIYVLLASALKLLDVPTLSLGIFLVVFALVAFPVWGAIDAAGRPDREWRRAGLDRRRWIRLQAVGAPFGVGFAAAVAYFAGARRRLVAVGAADAGDGVAVVADRMVQDPRGLG